MNNLYMQFTELVAKIAGTNDALSADKMAFIIRGLVLIGMFSVAFIMWYWRYTKNEPELRRALWWTIGILALVVLVKYAIYHFIKGYIPDRLIMYALPSPKAAGFAWFILPIVIFALFFRYQEKILNWPRWKFLGTLWAAFVSLALSVAATREGVYSIYERFTRIYWEYTGNLHLIKSLGDFFHNYISLHNSLVSHTVTHPPGFTALLYIFQKIFQAEYLGLSVLVVMFGGLAIVPIYYFLKEFLSEESARRGLTLYIFFPSAVLLGATSMDFTFVTFVWLSVVLIYKGWRGNYILSFLGGVAAALALLMNFLFILLAPLFGFLGYRAFTKGVSLKTLIIKSGVVVIACLGSLAALYFSTGYSIIENFFLARNIQSNIVESNFSSIGLYLAFACMNLTSFFIYLGLPNVTVLIKKIPLLWRTERRSLIGFGMVAFFVLIGIFQGETERIWLFLTPLFVLPLARIVNNYSARQYRALVSLLFFQIIVIQTLFYTYW